MLRYPKIIFLFVFFLFVLSSFSFAVDDTVTITTYYPSPYGSYNKLTTYSNTYLATNGGNVGIGTSSPGANLEVAGQVKITGGTPGTGKVLTSDADGLCNLVVFIQCCIRRRNARYL